MTLRTIYDEENGRTYFVEPVYAAPEEDDDETRRTLLDVVVVSVESESPDGSVEHWEGEAASRYVEHVREMLRQDESLLECLERPLSVHEQDEASSSHLQRMRDLRRRLKIRRNLDQDVG